MGLFTNDEGYVYARLGSGRVIGLHRYIWQSNYGKIPKGCHIHHLDLNPSNNHIDNLVLCTIIEHQNMHYHLRNFSNYLGMSKPLKAIEIW